MAESGFLVATATAEDTKDQISSAADDKFSEGGNSSKENPSVGSRGNCEADRNNDIHTPALASDQKCNQAEAPSLSLVAILSGHETSSGGRVWCVRWRPHSSQLVSCGGQRILLWGPSPLSQSKMKDGRSLFQKIWDVEAIIFNESEGGGGLDQPLASPCMSLLGNDGGHEAAPIPVHVDELPSTNSGAHERTVRSIAWTADGQKLAAASFDATASVWVEVASKGDSEPLGTSGGRSSRLEWRCVARIEGHENEVKGAEWSPSGRLLATCSRDKSVWIHSLDETHQTSSADTVAEEYSCAAVLTGHTQDVKCVRWHPQENFVASASYDNDIRLWRPVGDDWGCISQLTGHTSTVWSLSFSCNGDEFASCSDDQTVRIWTRRGRKHKKGQGKIYNSSKEISNSRDSLPSQPKLIAPSSSLKVESAAKSSPREPTPKTNVESSSLSTPPAVSSPFPPPFPSQRNRAAALGKKHPWFFVNPAFRAGALLASTSKLPPNLLQHPLKAFPSKSFSKSYANNHLTKWRPSQPPLDEFAELGSAAPKERAGTSVDANASEEILNTVIEVAAQQEEGSAHAVSAINGREDPRKQDSCSENEVAKAAAVEVVVSSETPSLLEEGAPTSLSMKAASSTEGRLDRREVLKLPDSGDGRILEGEKIVTNGKGGKCDSERESALETASERTKEVWDCSAVIQGYHDRVIYCVDWHPTEDVIATACGDDCIRVFRKISVRHSAHQDRINPSNPPPHRDLPSHHNESEFYDGENCSTDQPLDSAWILEWCLRDAHPADVNSVAWKREPEEDGSWLLASGGDDGAVRLFKYIGPGK